ncbi:MAG TPA: phenylalanine--tRNA ligase subunit beta [Gammaproteobacteria bacterium]|nr:phenylalanine--tRNA ligase subunit beta [Gammaproteobacteria bacterium]
MIISESWLREWVNPDLNTEELAASLTMAGLEVDSIAPVARDFSGVVVAEVRQVAQHPDADKLSVCSVFDGEQEYQVVCGAPNVVIGMKAPFALVGAEIEMEPSKPRKINKVKLRGIESHGMLCSAEELGLEESSEGLMELPPDAPVGQDFRAYFRLADTMIELDLTPNRGDCLGIRGVARELGVLSRMEICEPAVTAVKPVHTEEFPVSISAKEACPRYLGRVIRNVKLNARSPIWMQEKLRRSGLRSIDPVVDVTNFVLMELGQPMHAFDYEKLSGKICVRMADDGESITLLDGKEITLNRSNLVIADADKPVAMAGVMGGLATAVSDRTEHVFLECAYFSPLSIVGRARACGLHTDAAHRYERGVDYEIQRKAMERASELLLEIVGGEPGPITEATGMLPERSAVELRYASIEKGLGVKISASEVTDILSRLGFEISARGDESILVEVPSYRFDVSIEADLIEELARIFGYDNIPQTAGLSAQRFPKSSETSIETNRVRDHLVALGYQEIISYSFIDPFLSDLVTGGEPAISLQNPISEEMGVMRCSLLPGLLSSYQHNAKRQHGRVRFFETGLVFERRGDGIAQESRLGGLIAGSQLPKSWSNRGEHSDFYDLKGDVEVLLGLGGKTGQLNFFPAAETAYHPGQCAEIRSLADERIGVIGALHPTIQRELDLDHSVFVFELRLDQLLRARMPNVKTLSKYPEVHRDLAIVIDEAVSADSISTLVKASAGEFLTDLRIFDVYQGDAIVKGQKSVALGLTWQHPSRTLSDEEITAIISNCVNVLQEQFNADLRK